MMRSKNSKPGSGSIARKRCPRCKKVRAKWFGANYLWATKSRAMWQRHDDLLVCHICCDRLGLKPKFAPKSAQVKSHESTGNKQPFYHRMEILFTATEDLS